MDLTGSNRIEQNRTGSNRIEQDLTGSNMIEQDQTGSNRIEQDRTGSNRIKHDRTGSNRIEQDRAWSNRIEQDRICYLHFLEKSWFVIKDFETIPCVFDWVIPFILNILVLRLRKHFSFFLKSFFKMIHTGYWIWC